MERFFGGATVRQRAQEIGLVDCKPRLRKHELCKYAIEIVAAQAIDPDGADHLMVLDAHAHERSIERAAAEIVDDYMLAPAIERFPIAVPELEAGC
jgi:hypothetical protein